jgi:hypothetical protein
VGHDEVFRRWAILPQNHPDRLGARTCLARDQAFRWLGGHLIRTVFTLASFTLLVVAPVGWGDRTRGVTRSTRRPLSVIEAEPFGVRCCRWRAFGSNRSGASLFLMLRPVESFLSGFGGVSNDDTSVIIIIVREVGP